MTSLLHHPAPSAAVGAPPAIDSTVRLSLKPVLGRRVRADCPHLIARPAMLMLLALAFHAGPDPAARSPGIHRPAEPAEPADTPQIDELAGWENEGGHLTRQNPQDAPVPQVTGEAVRQQPASLPRSEHRMVVVDAFPLGRADPSEPTTIRLSGELDMFTSPELRSRLLDILKSSTSLLILDLSEVTFCDASGLAVMVGVQQRARRLGISLALAAPRPFMTKLLHITGLDRTLPIVV
ncbi:STAS domain-containing protein [Nonomuraea sp. NPDC050153]|uniref:STAS domain-containing protein n=1 Tax=Nonomuraea sp. NPDC050153 TaxID=3364359 RepID=UPI0037BA8352